MRILITRSLHQASELADALRALGAEPILIPTIELADPTTFAPLDAALATLTLPPQQGGFHWLLFTSANAVEAFAVRLQNSVILSEASLLHREAQSKDLQPRPDPAIPLDAFNQIRQQGIRIAAIGPATARALTAIGLPPPYFFAQSLERIGFRKTCGMVVDLLWKSRSGVACERASISILRGCGKYMCTLFENIIAIVFNDL